MKTNYYLIQTNVGYEVIAECGGKATRIPENNGYDVNTGVDLYAGGGN